MRATFVLLLGLSCNLPHVNAAGPEELTAYVQTSVRALQPEITPADAEAVEAHLQRLLSAIPLERYANPDYLERVRRSIDLQIRLLMAPGYQTGALRSLREVDLTPAVAALRARELTTEERLRVRKQMKSLFLAIETQLLEHLSTAQELHVLEDAGEPIRRYQTAVGPFLHCEPFFPGEVHRKTEALKSNHVERVAMDYAATLVRWAVASTLTLYELMLENVFVESQLTALPDAEFARVEQRVADFLRSRYGQERFVLGRNTLARDLGVCGLQLTTTAPRLDQIPALHTPVRDGLVFKNLRKAGKL